MYTFTLILWKILTIHDKQKNETRTVYLYFTILFGVCFIFNYLVRDQTINTEKLIQ